MEVSKEPFVRLPNTFQKGLSCHDIPLFMRLSWRLGKAAGTARLQLLVQFMELQGEVIYTSLFPPHERLSPTATRLGEPHARAHTPGCPSDSKITDGAADGTETSTGDRETRHIFSSATSTPWTAALALGMHRGRVSLLYSL